MHLISEGGPVFIIPMLIYLLIIIVLSVLDVFLSQSKRDLPRLIKQIGTIALSWGLIGSIIGAIGALDAIEGSGGASPAIIAGGLKITLLSTLLGLVVFFVSRVAGLLLSLRP